MYPTPRLAIVNTIFGNTVLTTRQPVDNIPASGPHIATRGIYG
jgi:hypothetical protein